MRGKDYIEKGVRSVVMDRSWCRCQYFGCTKIAAEIVESKVVCFGQFAHILPVGGSGPRSRFRPRYPLVELNSAENIILLCKEHHDLVDIHDIAGHPPERLFAMAAAKRAAIEEGVSDAILRAIEIEGDGRYWPSILKLLADAGSLAPAQARSCFAAASRLLKQNEDNVFTVRDPQAIDLVRLQILVLQTSLTYKTEYWAGAMRRARALLAKFSDSSAVATAATLMMIFVRDDYGALNAKDRAAMIRELIGLVSSKIDNVDIGNGMSATLLAIKAGLLRWQARLEKGISSAEHMLEAERCANKGITISWSAAGLLQRGLVTFARALSLRCDKIEEFEREQSAASEDIMSPLLDGFAAAEKYRPRFLRDSYRFSEAEARFWKLVNDGYGMNMKAVAFVLAEAVFSSIRYPNDPKPAGFLDAADYIKSALDDGFDHGRNVMAWIVSNALIDPDWFRVQVLAKLSDGDDRRSNWCSLIEKAAADRSVTAGSTSQDALFGIRDMEFWNMMGRTCRIALQEPERAVHFHQQAIRYSQDSRGRFTAHVGLARAYHQLGERGKASHETQIAADTALAHQSGIIKALRAEISVL